MKKVAVLCVAGKQGRCLVDEAAARGYDVTGFVRRKAEGLNPKAKIVVKDLFDLTREDLAGFDAVIDALGAWTEETLPDIPKAAEYLCADLVGRPFTQRRIGIHARFGRRCRRRNDPRDPVCVDRRRRRFRRVREQYGRIFVQPRAQRRRRCVEHTLGDRRRDYYSANRQLCLRQKRSPCHSRLE